MILSGAEGVRTPDLCIANAALSQLSYGPDWLGSRDVTHRKSPVNYSHRLNFCRCSADFRPDFHLGA